jgi:hypothetical protein
MLEAGTTVRVLEKPVPLTPMFAGGNNVGLLVDTTVTVTPEEPASTSSTVNGIIAAVFSTVFVSPMLLIVGLSVTGRKVTVKELDDVLLSVSRTDMVIIPLPN